MIQKSASLNYEPSLELLLITAEQLFAPSARKPPRSPLCVSNTNPTTETGGQPKLETLNHQPQPHAFILSPWTLSQTPNPKP